MKVLYDRHNCIVFLKKYVNEIFGIELPFRGSNHMLRELDFVMDRDEFLKEFKCIPRYSFVFKTRNRNHPSYSVPQKYWNDGIPDAYMVGITTEPICDDLDLVGWRYVGISYDILKSRRERYECSKTKTAG